MSNCPECRRDVVKPAITLHRGTDSDMEFCSTSCYTDWSFDRTMGLMDYWTPDAEELKEELENE